MASTQNESFDARAFLESSGMARPIVAYRRAEIIFSQGEPWEHVLYLQTGRVQLSVLAKTGREAVVAMLGPGEFFGEGASPATRSTWGVRRRPRIAASASWTRIR
jgi:CRP/FNR family transcriptional regulator, cyclic AMP receptor protein